MAHDDPFTLFGNTALTSGFDITGSSFTSTFDGSEATFDPAITVPVKPPATPKPVSGAVTAQVDFRLEGSRSLARTWRKRASDNIAAIRLAEEIERSGFRPGLTSRQY